MRLFLFVFLFIWSGSVAGSSPRVEDLAITPYTEPTCIRWGCDIKTPDSIRLDRTVTSVFEPSRQNGCCTGSSACGCTRGSVVCCDGSLSLTCQCR